MTLFAMTRFGDLVLGLHILAGTAALIAAPAAAVATKGARVHRLAGRTFFWAMAVVLASALVIQFLRPNPFLLAMAVLSFYLCFTGYRYAGLLGTPPDQNRRAADLLAAAITLIACTALVAYGIAAAAGADLGGWSGAGRVTGGASDLGVVAIALGSLGCTFALIDLLAFKRSAPTPNGWLFTHMGRMLGAWIAALSAFSAVNLRVLPPTIRWLWPAVIGTPLITAWIVAYGRRLHGRRAVVRTSGLETLRFDADPGENGVSST